MLCDAGANTECTAEMLLQFAYLASLYAEKINGIAKPRVGLVNNGTEDTKGDPLRKEAYALLKAAGDEGRLNFVGNAKYHTPVNGKDNITQFELIPWLLGSCAGIAEARTMLERLNVTDIPFSAGMPRSARRSRKPSTLALWAL